MSRIDTVNWLPVPELTGHTIRAGIVAYAVREPGCVCWRGMASDAIAEAVTIIETR